MSTRARHRRAADRRRARRHAVAGAVHRRAVLARLARRDPFAALTQHNLADYLTVAEGVSHFVYVAWNAGFDKPVTLLELELQAEVDKYVLGAWLLREQGAGRFPRELHRVLFERARVDPTAAAGRAGLYQTASEYARALLPAGGGRAWRAARAAPRASCSRNCGGSIAGEMRASCATSNASRSAARRARARQATRVRSASVRRNPCGLPVRASA